MAFNKKKSRVNLEPVTSHRHGVSPRNVANVTQVRKNLFFFCWYGNDEDCCAITGWYHVLFSRYVTSSWRRSSKCCQRNTSAQEFLFFFLLVWQWWGLLRHYWLTSCFVLSLPPPLLFPNGICAVAVSGSRYLTSNIRIDAIRKLAFFNDLLPTR